ncbi:MAG TPA: AzlC family ABC transporter permease [Ktedonobacteraceae bacterium]|jgi:4-azaleucine resistance transporter AzlC|nr:AzlC family ABC transporter permease [Ktedonobacteraceae bacterium]
MMTKRAEFLTGIKDTLPILLGVLPFGLIYGASAQETHVPSPVAQAMSSIVFAGSAQFVTVQLIAANVPIGMIILTAAIINLRHTLYSASLAPYLKRLGPFWQMLLAYLLTDEVYAVVITHYQQRGAEARKHWYFLGAGLALWSIWQMSTAVGILLGAHIPASWSLDFALPLTFIALVVPAIKRRADALVAGTAGIIAVLAAHFPLNSGLIVATCLGIIVGILIEAKSKKRHVPDGEQEGRTFYPQSPVRRLMKHARKEREQ